MRQYYVYIHGESVRSLCTSASPGICLDESQQHREGVSAGFTNRFRVTRLVYFEVCSEPLVAIAREKELKRWRRQKKLALIKTANPGWKDLAKGWFD